MNAILTGSRAYGIPCEDSDVDLVVLMKPSEAADLATSLGLEVTREGEGRYPALQFMQGRLNLIVVTDPKQFDIWVKGTELLSIRAPVTRQEAVELFAELRGA